MKLPIPRQLILTAARAARSILALALAAIAAVPILAQPKIVFDEKQVDLGVIQEGQKAKFTYTLRNEGDETLTISKVKGSCGCTKTEIDSTSIAPGETAAIKGNFNSRGRAGKQKKTIAVTSNDPVHTTFILKLKARVLGRFTIEPRTLALGRIDRDDARITTVTVQVRDARPVEIEKLSLNGLPDFEAELISRETGPDIIDDLTSTLTLTRFEIALKPPSRPQLGPFRGTMELKTDLPDIPAARLHVSGEFTGAIFTKPPHLGFGIVPHGATVHRSIQLFSRRSGPIKIDHIDVSGLPIEYRVDSSRPDSATVTFTLTAPEEDTHVQRRTITIYTTSPTREAIQMKVYYIVRERPEDPDKE